jgi:ribosomal protein S18 acetylase RimI-like enzyme
MTATGTTVRRATYRDFDAVDRLMQAFMALHHGWNPEQFRTAVLGFSAAIFQGWLERQDELHLAAETDAGVLGYACATRWEGRGNDFMWPRRGVYIPFIVVAPDQHRKGIGRALFRAIEAWAEEFEVEYVGFNVNPQNESAKAFYAALGYDVASEYRAKALRRVARLSASH